MAGFIIAAIVTIPFGLGWGIIAGLLAGLFKEMYDEYKYKGADFFDFFATIFGTFLGAIIITELL